MTENYLLLTSPNKINSALRSDSYSNTIKNKGNTTNLYKIALTDKEQALCRTLSEQYDATISLTQRSKNGYKFKINAPSLSQNYRFRTLEEAKTVLEDGFIRNRAKILPLISSRLARGRDPHNVSCLINATSKGAALVIDGGDDLAVSLENSGLPRKLVQIAQASLLYPLFIGLVHKGWSGAHEERLAYQTETQTQKQEQQAFKEALISLIEAELLAKEAACNNTNHDQLGQALVKHLAFKRQLISDLHEYINTYGGTTKAEIGLKELLKQVQLQAEHLNSTHHNKPSDELKNLSNQLNSKALDPKSAECHQLLESLAQYKAQQDSHLLTRIADHTAPILTETGLGHMYWGMIAFETRATTELIAGHSAAPFTQIMTSIGDAANALGQMQMVFAGLGKTFLASKEAQSLNQWLVDLKRLRRTEWPNDQVGEALDMLEQFKRREYNAKRWDTIGSTALTLGQLCMLLGGPCGSLVGLGLSALTYSGVSATIGGVALSQISAQLWSSRSLISGEAEPEQQAIHEGKLDQGASTLKELFGNRIHALHTLTTQKAEPKVWLDLCLSALKAPNINSQELLQKTIKKYESLESDQHQKFYLEALRKISPDSIMIIDTIKKTHQKQPLGAYLLALHQLEHWQEAQAGTLKNYIIPDSLGEQASELFRLAESIGIIKELERRIVKQMLNRFRLFGKRFDLSLQARYLQVIPVEKTKKPWAIPNPLGPITYLIEKSPLEKFLLQWHMPTGHKQTNIYIFQRDLWLQDLKSIGSSNIKNSLTPEQLRKLRSFSCDLISNTITDGFKYSFGHDQRNLVWQSLIKIKRPELRSNVLRPLYHGVAKEIERYQLTHKARCDEISFSNSLNMSKGNLCQIFNQIAHHDINHIQPFIKKLYDISSDTWLIGRQTDPAINDYLTLLEQIIDQTTPVSTNRNTKSKNIIDWIQKNSGQYYRLASNNQQWSLIKKSNNDILLFNSSTGTINHFTKLQQAVKFITNSYETLWTLYKDEPDNTHQTLLTKIINDTNNTISKKFDKCDEKMGQIKVGKIKFKRSDLWRFKAKLDGQPLNKNSLIQATIFDPKNIKLNADQIQRFLSSLNTEQANQWLKNIRLCYESGISFEGNPANISRLYDKAHFIYSKNTSKQNILNKIKHHIRV